MAVEKTFTKVRWDRKNQDKDQDEGDQRTEGEQSFNKERNEIDMRKMAATDLPFNNRTYLPHALDESSEIEMHVLKQRIKEVKRFPKEKSLRNLTEEQFKGIKGLRDRQKNDEIVVFQTDKSAKLAVDTPENYIESMKQHTEKRTGRQRRRTWTLPGTHC